MSRQSDNSKLISRILAIKEALGDILAEDVGRIAAGFYLNDVIVAKAKGKKIGICGQAPSDFPDFAEFLVGCGIDSISLVSDTVTKTRLVVANREKALGRIP